MALISILTSEVCELARDRTRLTNLEILDTARVHDRVFWDDDLHPVPFLLKRAADSGHHVSQTSHLMRFSHLMRRLLLCSMNKAKQLEIIQRFNYLNIFHKAFASTVRD